MTLTIVALTNQEEFLTFLDPELCELVETIETGGLRTLQLTYQFQDREEDKEYFRMGNKIWVQGDTNLSDCLYVINTEVTQDIFKENTFKLELEEVLVELNYAPVFSQTELTTAVDEDDNSIFHLYTSNQKQEVYVDWNALNYWFGSYFNIGVVQKCMSDYASKISITGTVNLMNLLRQIEEETGNVFVTRYEKDVLTNTIHRYLDFLNPINVNKNWQYILEYDFKDIGESICYEDDTMEEETTEDNPWQATRYHNTAFGPEEITETTDVSHEDDYDVEVSETYDAEANETYDYEKSPDYNQIYNIDPDNCEFRICDKDLNLLNTDGEKYHTGDTALSWNCGDVGMTDTDSPSYTIILQKEGADIGIKVNEKSYVASMGIGGRTIPFCEELRDNTEDPGYVVIDNDDERSYSKLPDNSYLVMYDTTHSIVLFKTLLNLEIGTVHDEILDFGRNLENITYNVNETDTYTAVSPIIQVNDNNTNGKELSRNDVNTIINRWLNLDISKGDVVPMIVEKMNITAASLSAAQSSLGTKTVNSNYWSRPLKPNDNIDSTDKQFEFYRGVAYWKAPYTKNAGEIFVRTDKGQNIQYTDIYTRPDARDEKWGVGNPKTANTETSDEDVFAIYNQVCNYLKEHETPNVDIQLDVANLRGHQYNNYDLHDKIYIKLPNTNELITTRVTKTTKEAHDIAKNTIEISNYKAVNTVKTLTHETYIECANASFKYPKSKTLTARLVNTLPEEGVDQYPSARLLTFSLYKLENGSRSFTGTTYTKLTNGNGYASINMKYDPGDYEIDIEFAGDEEFEESSLTINVNVSGTKEVPTTNRTTNRTTTTSKKTNKTNKKQKTTKKTKKKKTKKVATYYDKYGRSPDKKKILAIGRISSGRDKGSYANFYETEFKNYCPKCGKNGTLMWGIFWAGNETSNYGRFPGTGNSEGSSAEGAIFCSNQSCDGDWSVQGYEHGYSNTRLTVTKATKKSLKSRAYSLKKGKIKYGTKTITVKEKKVENKKERKIRAAGISNKVKKQALAIVKDKTGYKAARAIVDWLDAHIKYANYPNFQRSPETVLSRGSGNCCDVTRLCFQMLDAAGCCEYFKLHYIHVYGHVYGLVTTKKTGKSRTVDCASDYHAAWGYICQDYRGLAVLHKTLYPTRPF